VRPSDCARPFDRFDAALDQLGDGQLLEGWYRTLGAGDAMAAPGVAGV
jgi:hypothetical protein